MCIRIVSVMNVKLMASSLLFLIVGVGTFLPQVLEPRSRVSYPELEGLSSTTNHSNPEVDRYYPEMAMGADDALELSMTTDRTIIGVGEIININMTLENAGNDTVTLVFPSTQVFDVYLCIHGRPMHPTLAWSAGHAFDQIICKRTLDPGGAINDTLQWHLTQAEPGHYELLGVCVAYQRIWTDPSSTRTDCLWILPE